MVLKRTAQLSVLITPEERKILDAYCSLVDLPMARVISQLIREHLKPEARMIHRSFNSLDEAKSFASLNGFDFAECYCQMAPDSYSPAFSLKTKNTSHLYHLEGAVWNLVIGGPRS